jgi:hypothetical protein
MGARGVTWTGQGDVTGDERIMPDAAVSIVARFVGRDPT